MSTAPATIIDEQVSRSVDIRAQLLKEHSRANAEAIADHVGRDPKRFAALMEHMLNDSFRVAQRAAYSVSIVCDRQPTVIAPYLSRLLDLLDRPVHEAVQRTSIRILQTCDLPEELHGRITDLMFARIADPGRSIAQRAFAITVGMRMVRMHPALADEFELLLADVLRVDPGPAIRSRARKARAELDGILSGKPGRS